MLANPIEQAPTSEKPTCELADIPPFADLPEAVLDAVASCAETRHCAEGETIFAMGQYDGSEILIVRSGGLRASYADAESGAMLFEEVSEKEIFGLAAAVLGAEDARYAQMSVSAEKDSEIIFVDAEGFRSVVAQRPSLTKSLMMHFAGVVAGGGYRQNASESSPDRRVYASLIEFVERDAVSADWRIPRMPKHRELADRANVDESVAAAAIANLIQSGVARREYPGLVIADIAQLNRLAS